MFHVEHGVRHRGSIDDTPGLGAQPGDEQLRLRFSEQSPKPIGGAFVEFRINVVEEPERWREPRHPVDTFCSELKQADGDLCLATGKSRWRAVAGDSDIGSVCTREGLTALNLRAPPPLQDIQQIGILRPAAIEKQVAAVEKGKVLCEGSELGPPTV